MSKLLPPSIIGIDVETTDLDPSQGEIIEVAAIRYSFDSLPLMRGGDQEGVGNHPIPSFPSSGGKGIEGKFVRLCKPRAPISAEITALTGITNEMVARQYGGQADAPAFAEVADDLADFIGDSLVFAHNASFDLAWLRYHGLSLATNKVWDTFPLASVAWPEAESYNLGALYELYGAPFALRQAQSALRNSKGDLAQGSSPGRGAHSAEYDVEMAWRVLRAAREALVAAPVTHRAIVELLERTGLAHYIPLFSAASEQGVERARSRHAPPPGGPVGPAGGGPPARHPLEDISSIFGPEGLLAERWPDFVPRAPQQEMATLVETIVQEGGTALIEAPTGSGKTVAYLAPLFLTPSPKKAVISTHTKHLQDQLLAHDVPLLQNALGSDLSVTVLKGRRNYVCAERLWRAWEKAAISPSEAWYLIKVRLWLERGGSGDLNRLNISHLGNSPAIHADSFICRRACGRRAESPCPYEAAARAAEATPVLIVNHALLADPNFANRWPLGTVVIDEAHHLEEALRRATAAALQPWHLQDLLSPLLQESPDGGASRRHLTIEAEELLEEYGELLEQIKAVGIPHKNSVPMQRRLTPAVRRSREWGAIERTHEHWHGRCQFLAGLLEGAGSALPAGEALELRANLQAFSRDVARFISGSPERIQWVETDQTRARLYLNDVALSITESVERLRRAAHGLVLTSATLTTGADFSYIKSQLGLSEAHELILPSSFALQKNLLLYLVDDAPDPRNASYDQFIAEEIRKISLLLQGRTLGLFTSLKSVSAVFKLLVRPLNKATIKLYAQGHSGGKTNMLKRFREQERSVLLGTDSFWEGVDIPGATLSCVVIPKLPFPLPHEPVVEAVAEHTGQDAFSALSLPQMILKLRQGIGRLIRRHTDRGVVVIFDSRLLRSSYGEVVLKSLPNGRIQIGSSADLSAVIADWMGEEVIKKWRDS